MPLNYSKWDNLELSDDSDVEVHPNIDKKSFIRWKQRDIHEKRDQRKSERIALQTEMGINDILAPLLAQLLASTRAQGSSAYSREVSRLSAGRADRGNKDGPDGPTTDDMMLSLLLQIQQQDDVKPKTGAELDEALVSNLEKHTHLLADRQTKIKFELEQMDKEDAKKITSDTIRDGFDSGYVAKAEQPEPEPAPKPKAKKAPQSTVIETLNSPATTAAADKDDDSEDEEEDVRKASSVMLQFANLPSCIPASIPLSASTVPSTFNPAKQLDTKPFEQALQFLSAHKTLLSERSGTTDSLLLEAFDAQMAGKAKLARQCVEKSLLIQYCNKLGPDGVNLFFRRMVGSQDGKASLVYINDVLATYTRISERSKVLAAEQSAAGSSAGQEQIQLVAENPDTVIGFEIPSGPPPEHIELEGEAKDTLDPEQVRAWLQRQWDIFTAFPSELQTALKTKELDQVNKVLGNMPVDQAEEIVGQLDQAGILSFSSSEVRDETGR